MSLKEADVTLADGAPRRSFLELNREDQRVICNSREKEDSLPFVSLPRVNVTRTLPTRTSEQQRDMFASGESVQLDFPAYSSTEMVVTPPFIPTEREHNFFMKDEDSQSVGDGDAHRTVRPGLDSAQSSTVTFDAVMPRRMIATAAVVTPSAGAQDTTDVRTAASFGLPSAALEGQDTPRQPEQPATYTKTAVHGCPQGKRRFSLVAKAPAFDAAREQQRNLITMGLGGSLPLYKFEEIPSWQRYNPYIRSRYRAFYTAEMCFKSLLGWHNETINVYSHLLTFVVFLVMTALLYTTVLSKAITAPSLRASKLIYGIFCFGSLICMLNSTIYHLFNSHCSCRVMTAMGRLDFIGITALIVSSFLPPLYVMFHCHPVARTMYITAILLLSTAGIIGPWTDLFHKHVQVRLSVFLGLGFSGLAPALHSLAILPMNAASGSTLLGICLMVVLYCSGVAFYVTQFPESRYPGHFDCWLSSHQLWHFFVSMAALVHYCNCVSMYQMWQVSDGMCG
ncbi:conserved hypothetical protein [Leishmania infantum JPCM5]|uniref:Adiponectin_receptor_protein_1_-_putative n=2 Tax=Leishmania infantum TaxID=5671 RepID=A0A6L0XT10_LEIIN|nr:conserved hypothetical protein [Leishmania infantum JPCM5]CAC9552554.1 adiponectin_receptor_protein_1_-_putative [Leishmania infantum]CAM73050.1 conserved hypothetical protein [Leishmania infantum JPCM5]SUZ46956.1 adiponectin_receptor_protein_1_-_putative [Leishmania infantum]|eukprot:XP_001469934.1 conserved hypothetical protein [Leishmania infantum JPCM5]